MPITPVTMPQLGESVTEGTIGKWLKQPGDTIEKYESLAEVITDKVNAEIPSPVSGVIKELKGGQKIVIQVDNAPDKTYNLSDKNRTISVAETLAVGDRVKIMESKETKGVQIVRDVKADQGERSRTENDKK